MNITIFGDSFSDDKIGSLLQTETSWIDVLRENGHNVTNYAQGGSSLYYSYNRYLSYIDTPDYLNCNLVIFVITGPGREEVTIDEDTFYLTNIHQIEAIRDHLTNSEEQRKIMEALRVYWAFCKDSRKDQVIHDLIVKDIKQKEKLFFIETWVEENDNGMVNMSRKEFLSMNPGETNELIFMKENKDNRKCHFTSVNNKMIGNKILQAISANQKTVEFDLNDIVKPEFDLQYYFSKYE